MPHRKKLIEVALPLEAINLESAREKSIRHGHPSTLHLWWARRPLAACRAVLWASLVDDPSSWPDKFPTEVDQTRERQRLFNILGRIETETDKKGNQKQVVRGLVSWDDVNDPNSGVLEAAQREIARCLAWERGEEPPTKPDAVRAYIAQYAPPVYDPFAGGGSIPLEAQRLGLEAHASDLNPVAVLINKALIEIPPRFKDQAPVNPEDRAKKNISSWRGAQGLAADVRFYGAWMRERAFERIGHLYPLCSLGLSGENENHKGTKGTEATVIAWLWARTVKCPNPACGCAMPLVRSFQLSTKKGKEAWVEPIVENHKDTKDTKQDDPLCSSCLSGSNSAKIRFVVKSGQGKAPEGTVDRKGARCIACETPVPLEYIRQEGRAGRMGQQLMAIVAEGQNGRVYLAPTAEQEAIANSAQPEWKPDTDLPKEALGFRVQNYGMTKHADLFTPRQLVALTTFSDLVGEAREKAIQDAVAAGLPDDDVPLNGGGTGARAYGDAIATYAAFALSKASDLASTLCHWQPNPQHLKIAPTFSRHSLSMSWDFAEGNPFSDSSGNFFRQWELITKSIDLLGFGEQASVTQQDARKLATSKPVIISTDPPYYDNIPYADLSDFFYIWLRQSIKEIYRDVFKTLLVPKSEELVADFTRHNSKEEAKVFFEQGLSSVFLACRESSNLEYPLTVYYAFKQSEAESLSRQSDAMVASTGWETILEALIQQGFLIAGTWPVRTERSGRMRDFASNALATSILLVCRPRPTNAPKITRRQFLTELKRQLPPALKTLQQGNIAPVDLAQASIGPSMAIYSQYAAVLENDGTPLRVRTALQLINQTLDEYLTEQEGEFDSDTRWALTWFEQHQFNAGPYGDAETLSKAKNTSVQGMAAAGILEAKGGKVRLLQRSELKPDWNPAQDHRIPDWEITQHLIHTLDQQGETGAAALLAKLGSRGDIARDLAYRLYSLCDRKNWTQEAIAYNSLVISWPEINRLASEVKANDTQTELF